MSDRNWVVVGAGGMLARDVLGVLEGTGANVRTFDRAALDITSPDAVRSALAGLRAGDVVVNCAAWTAVDDAETREGDAFAVNAVGAQLVARACAATGAAMVQVSTDYVFDGEATTPYPVDAPIAPKSAYGRTKAAGEWAVRAELDAAWIVRTAWLYGDGPSFVRTMGRLEATREFVEVVDDQHGQPTWTRDLAARIVEMVTVAAPFGTYHGCNSGETSWHGLATAVFEAKGADAARVHRTTSAAFVRPAPRPSYSVLDLSGWQAADLKPMRPWHDALTESLTTGTILT